MKSARIYALAFAAYAAIACLITWPLLTVIGERVIGHPFGDAYEYTSMAWWLREAIARGVDPYYHRLIVYPDGASALWLWSAPLQSWPTVILSFVMPLMTAFNVAALLTLALNGLAMFALVRGLVTGNGRAAAAFVAGVVWLALPAVQGHLGAAHTGLITLWGVPLWTLALIRVGRGVSPSPTPVGEGSGVGVFVAALLFPLALAGNPTIVITLIAPIALAVLLMSGRGWPRVMLALIAGGLVWLPLAAPFLLESLRGTTALAASVGGSVTYSAPALAIVSPAVGHPLWGGLDYPGAVVGREPFELTSYIGLASGLIALFAVVRVRAARGWALLALAAWIASLGAILKITDTPFVVAYDGIASGVALPWALVQDLPGISLARTPGRFGIAVGFALAILVGYGVAALLAHRRRAVTALAAVGLSVLIVADFQTWFPLPTAPAIVPGPIRDLATSPSIRAVLDLPIGHPLTSKEALFLQTGHGLPIVIGHVTRRTPIDPAKAALLEDTLDPALLDQAGADVVILHRQWDDPAADLENRLVALAGDPLYSDDAYAVWRIPVYSGEPAPFRWTAPPRPTTIARDPFAVSVYTPVETGALLTVQLAAPDGPRDVVAALDGAEVARWTIDGAAAPAIWVVFPPGYHRVTLALDPPCAVPIDATFRCRAVTVDGVSLDR